MTLKVTSYENALLLFFTLNSTTCLLLVKATASQGFDLPYNIAGGDEVIESGAWRICSECQRQVPRQTSHCRKCRTCFMLRDHHCLWLNTCISYVNDRWFFLSLFFGLLALLYVVCITFTTVCHPRLVNLYLFTVLFPSHCNNAYYNWSMGLASSAGFYCIILAVCTFVLLVQQSVCIIYGVRLREFKARKQLPGAIQFSFPMGFTNCYKFWYRKT